jgi:hypothetical protein
VALVLAAAFPFHRRRRRRRLCLRTCLPPVRGLRHPGLRPSPGRQGVLRGSDQGPPGRRPSRPGGAHFRAQGDLPHPGRLPHQVVTKGVNPQLECTTTAPPAWSSTFKAHRVLRTETVISEAQTVAKLEPEREGPMRGQPGRTPSRARPTRRRSSRGWSSCAGNLLGPSASPCQSRATGAQGQLPH